MHIQLLDRLATVVEVAISRTQVYIRVGALGFHAYADTRAQGEAAAWVEIEPGAVHARVLGWLMVADRPFARRQTLA